MQKYEQYLILSKITLDKNYIIVSLAYLFEAIREYCSYSFELHLGDINIKNGYKRNTAVMDTISNFVRGGRKNEIQKKYPQLYKKNKSIFCRISKVYEEIRKFRNDLAHINDKKDFHNVKETILNISFKVETLFKDNVLKNMQI